MFDLPAGDNLALDGFFGHTDDAATEYRLVDTETDARYRDRTPPVS